MTGWRTNLLVSLFVLICVGIYYLAGLMEIYAWGKYINGQWVVIQSGWKLAIDLWPTTLFGILLGATLSTLSLFFLLPWAINQDLFDQNRKLHQELDRVHDRFSTVYEEARSQVTNKVREKMAFAQQLRVEAHEEMSVAKNERLNIRTTIRESILKYERENASLRKELDEVNRSLASAKNKFEKLEKVAAGLGNIPPAPFALLSFIALPVIPELRLTDFGLVDVIEFKIIN